MPDHRVHCVPAQAAASELRLTPEESHHLVTVNRARVGDPVVAFDGQGREWLGTLTTASKRAAVLRVQESRAAPPRAVHLTLVQALPKGGSMDAIVRKATEIGAARIVPLETDRVQVHLEGDRGDRKIGKWQTAALEAAKQCGNPWLPEITDVQPLRAFLATASEEGGLNLIASLAPGAQALRPALAAWTAHYGRRPARVSWLIGPEGDFSPEETRLALEHGWLPITLGPLVLRCETAATYALSILSYELSLD